MRMDNVSARLNCQLANVCNRRSVNLALAGNQMRFNAFLDSPFVKLMIWIRGVRE
jgi:hypothetical protein